MKPYVQSSQQGVAFYKKNCLIEMMASISNHIRDLRWDVITHPKRLTVSSVEIRALMSTYIFMFLWMRPLINALILTLVEPISVNINALGYFQESSTIVRKQYTGGSIAVIMLAIDLVIFLYPLALINISISIRISCNGPACNRNGENKKLLNIQNK